MDRRRMTVLQLLPALEGGGVEKGVLEVSEALVGAGHRSLVVSRGGRLVADLKAHGSEHFQCPVGAKTPWTLRWVPWLKRLMQRESVDVVDLHSRLPGWIGLLAWKSLPAAVRPALITSFHGLHSPGRYSSIMCRGQRVVVVSETMRNHVLRHYPWVPPENLRLIHRGIEASEFPRRDSADACWTSDFMRQFPQLKGQSLVTVVGRISRLKGHADFLHILADLRQRGLPAHGLIVGGFSSGRSSLQSKLRGLIQRLRLKDHVTLTGPQHDMQQIYAMSKVVLSVSQKPESFGRTVAEALSVGIPVVGYEHGGVGEILARQYPDGAVPAGDVAAAAEKTSRLLTGAHVPAIGPNPFTRQQMLNETLSLYRELCDERFRTAA